MFDRREAGGGMQVSIPISRFGQRLNKAKAARAEHDDTNDRLILKMTLAYNNLDESLFERPLAEALAVSAEEKLCTSRIQYEKGIETLSDYHGAQIIWQQARQTQVGANCYLRWLKYPKATGSIN